MDRQVMAVLVEVIPNPAGAAVTVVVASLPEVLVAAFGSKAVVGVGPGDGHPDPGGGVPSHED
jgi:hypothetical protein